MLFKQLPSQIGVCACAGLFLVSCVSERKIDLVPGEIATFSQRQEQGVFQVAGCVYHPGTFSIKPGQTVKLSEVIKKAGGTINGNYFAGERSASLRRVKVMRYEKGSVVEFTLDVWKGTGGSFIIKSGDRIYVPELA